MLDREEMLRINALLLKNPLHEDQEINKHAYKKAI